MSYGSVQTILIILICIILLRVYDFVMRRAFGLLAHAPYALTGALLPAVNTRAPPLVNNVFRKI